MSWKCRMFHVVWNSIPIGNMDCFLLVNTESLVKKNFWYTKQQLLLKYQKLLYLINTEVWYAVSNFEWQEYSQIVTNEDIFQVVWNGKSCMYSFPQLQRMDLFQRHHYGLRKACCDYIQYFKNLMWQNCTDFFCYVFLVHNLKVGKWQIKSIFWWKSLENSMTSSVVKEFKYYNIAMFWAWPPLWSRS